MCELDDGRKVLVLFCSATVAPLDCSLEATAPRKGGSFAQLRCALRKHKPHILWFAGHGDAALPDGERTLGFSGPDGALELLDPVVLATELRDHMKLSGSGGNLECAVLNACCTGGAVGRADGGLGSLGDLLHQCGMPAVLCWGSRVHNEASAHFARGFGEALVDGKTYSEAFAQAKKEICAQLEPAAGSKPTSPSPGAKPGGGGGVTVQRFELIDPLDGRVVQPADVTTGAAPP